MKIINITPGLISIPPNGWGAIEKIIWDYHLELNKLNIRNEIKYLNDVKYDESMVVHVHVANLANMLHERGVPYIFSIHDHHAFLYGKDSHVYKENLKAIENSVFSLSPCKFLIPYFGSKKLRYLSHAVNTGVFTYNAREMSIKPKLLCVANNGYANDQSKDRKGFAIAIQAAKSLGLPLTIAGPRNNDNFFKTLDPELNNYEQLTKIYDLDEKSLIELYNSHDIFLHFSELEAGHPNLTLLEAMACGLPVVGTFEEQKYKGMIVTSRDISEAIRGIEDVRLNYKAYKNAALENAKENSHSNRVHDLAKLYSEYRECIFGNQLIDSYNNTDVVYKEPKKPENKIKITFDDGAKVDIPGPVDKSYKIKFIDFHTGHVVYETKLKNNMWASTSTKYFNKWVVEVYDTSDGYDVLVEKHTFDPKNKKVKIVLDSESLGDLLAWIGAVDEFQKKHQCIMECAVFNKVLRPMFEKNYPNIKFLAVDVYTDPYYAKYKIGCFDGENSKNYIPTDPRLLNLCSIATTILGLTNIEYKPKITFDANKYKNVKKKYVCIATQSTCQAKYWNNKTGWKTVVDYLKRNGYEVWCIDRHNSFGVDKSMNYMPEGCVDKTGDFTLDERMAQIAGAQFFIGLSSGLSWLAWAVDKPVVLISGFTKNLNEFHTEYRVINENVCNGCWNDVSCKFSRNDWFWCPRNKNFECSKEISADMVLKQVKKLI